MTNWIIWAVTQMVDATAGPNSFKGKLSLSAWAAICRDGAYHAPYSHPDSAWSGVYYVDSGTDNPSRPLSGTLEFLDPRAGVEAVTAPGDPYGEPVRIWPQSGLLVTFPSWLYHWVHPYVGQTPRIAISFNAAMRPTCEHDLHERARLSNEVTTQLVEGETSNVDSRVIPEIFSRIGVDVSYAPHDFCLRTVSCNPAKQHSRRFGTPTERGRG